MAVIAIFTLATSAGITIVVVATILVIIGVRQEERRQTLLDDRPPTILALLARRVLGVHFHMTSARLPDGAERPRCRCERCRREGNRPARH